MATGLTANEKRALSRVVRALDDRSPWRDSWCPLVAVVDGWRCELAGGGRFLLETPHGAWDVSRGRLGARLCQGWRSSARALLERERREARRADDRRRKKRRMARARESADCLNCGARCHEKALCCEKCRQWEKRVPAFVEENRKLCDAGRWLSLWSRWRAANPHVHMTRRAFFARVYETDKRLDLFAYGISPNGKWHESLGMEDAA